MSIKSIGNRIVSFGVIMLYTVPLLAQGMPGDPGTDPDVKVPFDGGLSLLIAAGVSYGVKRAYDHRKRNQHTASQDKE